jgi:hypothetical protein
VGKTETLGASNLSLSHTRLPVYNSRFFKSPSSLSNIGGPIVLISGDRR